MGGVLLIAILLLGGAGSALADMGAGIEAYERGDYAAARAAWGPLAADGDAQAQYFLGNLYAKGDGVARDLGQALYWFRAAAEQGESYGQFALGYVYEHGLGAAPNLAAACWAGVILAAKRAWLRAARSGSSPGPAAARAYQA